MLRTTADSPGYVRAELAGSIDNPEVREEIRRNMDRYAIAPQAVAFAIEQPPDVEIGEIVIRPATQA